MAGEKAVNIVLDTIEKFRAWNSGLTGWNNWVRIQVGLDSQFVEDEFTLTLKGEAARHLWDEGRGRANWNDWIARHPNAKVDLSSQIFNPTDKGDGKGACIDFSSFHFPTGGAIFSNSIFDGKHDIDFLYAKFFGGNVDFTSSRFVGGRANFFGAFFRCESVSFRFCQFENSAHFGALSAVSEPKIFSFEGASFKSYFTISANSDNRFGCPVDLRVTSLSNDMVVQDIGCDLALERRRWDAWVPKAKDRQDSQRFRKLKEFAVENRNHAKALEFHVQEIRARRGWETKWWQDISQFFFWAFGDYGRSVVRPFGWMAASCLGFAACFWTIRTPINGFADEGLAATAEASRDFLTALTYSASNMLSFIPTGRTAKQQGEELLFGGTVPDEILLLSGAQSILAVILLFLLGLGLRNLFRV